jgi:hypothetical protein
LVYDLADDLLSDFVAGEIQEYIFERRRPL